MAVPKYNEFFPSFLLSLKDGQSRSIKEIMAYCAKSFNLTDEDIKLTLPSGKRTYLYDRVGWAKTYLNKAGLVMTAGRGQYRLTDEGLRVANSEAESVTLEYLSKYDSFNEFFQRKITEKSETTETKPEKSVENTLSPQEQIDNAISEMNKVLADELMEEVMKISPFDFEKLIIKLLVAMGYGSMLNNQDAVTKKTGDEGIDGVLTADKFGFDSIYIQAKQWKAGSAVGRPEIQKFGGAMMGQGANKGLFITTAKFTAEAAEYARKNLASKIVLVDGEALARLMIEYDIGVSTVETYRIKKVDTDFFTDFD